MEDATKYVAAYIPESLYRELRRVATLDQRSTSYIIREAIKKFLEPAVIDVKQIMEDATA